MVDPFPDRFPAPRIDERGSAFARQVLLRSICRSWLGMTQDSLKISLKLGKVGQRRVSSGLPPPIQPGCIFAAVLESIVWPKWPNYHYMKA